MGQTTERISEYRNKYIEYPCGCRYLFDHRIVLERICTEHENELIAHHGWCGIRQTLEETWGFVTKEHRQLWDLPKEHVFDAAVIATRGRQPIFQMTTLIAKRCVSDGDYQQTKGIRSEQRMVTGKIGGFRKFDKVRYGGQNYFIKGRMSTGYAILMDLAGNKVALKPIPKFKKMKRVSARRSWIMTERTIPSCSCSPT